MYACLPHPVAHQYDNSCPQTPHAANPRRIAQKGRTIHCCATTDPSLNVRPLSKMSMSALVPHAGPRVTQNIEYVLGEHARMY